MGGAPDLLLDRVGALFRCDARGRLVSVNEWDGGPAPRFYLLRAAGRVICRFRADVPEALARRLEALCAHEPAGWPPGRLPALHSAYLDLLASQAPVERVWAGPTYAFAGEVHPSISPIAIGSDNADLLHGGFGDWLLDVPHRQPFVAIVEGGRAVSLCCSVRISPTVHCAGVKTLASYRRRGHAVNAVAGWAAAVRALEAAPFYSTSWDNEASQGVAVRLGLSLAGVDFHVT